MSAHPRGLDLNPDNIDLPPELPQSGRVAQSGRTGGSTPEEEPPANQITLQDLTAAGLTYRQVYHWCTSGLLRPDPRRKGATSGIPYMFAAEELRVAQSMGRLVKAGLTVKAAHTVARGGQLPGGVRVWIEEGEGG